MTIDSVKSVRLRITGKVQGVGYRDWAARTARRLNLSGWVRNRFDQSVEAVVSGAGEQVDEFILSAHRGPPSARVTGVSEAASAPPDHADFRVLPNS